MTQAAGDVDELHAMRRLQDLLGRLIAAPDTRAVLEEILDAAIAL